MRLVVGISGASGIVYATRLLDVLKQRDDVTIEVIVSKEAVMVAHHEPCWNGKPCELIELLRRWNIRHYLEDDLLSPLASSSNTPDAVVIIPCSMKTLSAIASSYQDNLLVRTAHIALRMKKPLVLVIRETPLSTIDILNMLKVSMAGAIILPASPAFYIRPRSVEDLIDFIVGKVLDVLNMEHKLYNRWSHPR